MNFNLLNVFNKLKFHWLMLNFKLTDFIFPPVLPTSCD